MSIMKIHQTTIEILFNVWSHTATFSCGLRSLENGLLNVHRYVSATISHPDSSVGVAPTKCLGE